MNPLIGTNLNIAYSLDNQTWHYFGYAKNCKLKKSRKTIEVSSPTTGDSECYIPGRKGWSMSCSCLLGSDINALEALYNAGTVFYVSLRETNNSTGYEDRGQCFIKSLSKSADIHQMAKLDIELQGTGALTYQAR